MDLPNHNNNINNNGINRNTYNNNNEDGESVSRPLNH